MDKIQETTVFDISPDRVGGVNEMRLTFVKGERQFGSKYSIHYWNDSLDELIGRLERMVAALKKFKAVRGLE